MADKTISFRGYAFGKIEIRRIESSELVQYFFYWGLGGRKSV